MVLKEVQCFFYPIKTRVAFDSSTGFVLIIPVFPDLDKNSSARTKNKTMAKTEYYFYRHKNSIAI